MFATQNTCTGTPRFRDDLIVEVVDGAYRARHATGGDLAVSNASAPGEPCSLTLSETGHDAGSDTSYGMTWELGDAPRGSYQDREPWTACTHEFRALAVRRDVTPADTAFDPEPARAAMRAWWAQFERCRPAITHEVGHREVPAEIVIEASGRIARIRVRGETHHLRCSTYRCPCATVANPAGAPQSVALTLPLSP